MAALPRSAAACGVPALSSRLSTSVSTRDTKNEATEAIRAVPSGLAGLLHAGQERLDHLAVAGQRKDQRDVDADPSARQAVIAGRPSAAWQTSRSSHLHVIAQLAFISAHVRDLVIRVPVRWAATRAPEQP